MDKRARRGEFADEGRRKDETSIPIGADDGPGLRIQSSVNSDDTAHKFDSDATMNISNHALLNAIDQNELKGFYQQNEMNAMNYDSRSWFKSLFRCKGRSCPFQPLLMLGSWTGTFIIINKYVYSSMYVPVDGNLMSLFALIMGLLLVFRTQRASARWWEARCIWQQLSGTSREVVRGIAASAYEDKYLVRFAGLLVIGFSHFVKNSVRDVISDDAEVQRVRDHLFKNNVPKKYEKLVDIMFDKAPGHKGMRTLDILERILDDAVKEGLVGDMERTRINELIHKMNGCFGVCMRIHTTPLPLPYTIHLRSVLFFYFMVLPLDIMKDATVNGIFLWCSCMFVASLVLGVEALAVGIEDPFGTDLGDLPLEQYCNTIFDQVRDICKFNRQLDWMDEPIPGNEETTRD